MKIPIRLNEKWKQACLWVDSRTMRDRLLLMFAILFVIFLLWNLLLQAGLRKEKNLYASQIASVLDQTKQFEDKIKVLEAEYKKNPKLGLQATHQTLKEEVAMLNKNLELVVANVVSAQELTKVLDGILDDSKGVSLIAMKNLPPVKLEQAYEDISHPGSNPVLYQEGVEIQFKADYFSTLDYLQKLEKTRLNFFWDQMVYDVQKYPEAQVKLNLYFISKGE